MIAARPTDALSQPWAFPRRSDDRRPPRRRLQISSVYAESEKTGSPQTENRPKPKTRAKERPGQ